MHDLGDLTALMLLWLAFMTVIGVYVVRIGLMLREQRLKERACRLRLALRMGKAVRETSGPTGT